jgi:hypothetical protein
MNNTKLFEGICDTVLRKHFNQREKRERERERERESWRKLHSKEVQDFFRLTRNY